MNCLNCGKDIGNNLGLCSECKAPSRTRDSQAVEAPKVVQRKPTIHVPPWCIGTLFVVFALIVVIINAPNIPWGDFKRLKITGPQLGLPGFQLALVLNTGKLAAPLTTAPLSPKQCRDMAPGESLIFHGTYARPEYTLPSSLWFGCCDSSERCLFYRGIPQGQVDMQNNLPPVTFCCLPTGVEDHPALPCDRDPSVPLCS